MAKDDAAALKGMALARALSAAEVEAIAAIAVTREIAAGKALFGEGDTGDGLYLIVAGEIDVIKKSARGERSLAHLGAGAVLGEISLLTNEARSATGRALTRVSALHLPAARFRALLDSASPAALKMVAAIAEVLAHRLAAMNAKVLELADKVDPGGAAPQSVKDKDLAELHRTMQVWSF